MANNSFVLDLGDAPEQLHFDENMADAGGDNASFEGGDNESMENGNEQYIDDGNDQFVENDLEPMQDDESGLQGYDDYVQNEEDEDDHYSEGPTPKRTRSAFYSGALKSAERAALRTKPGLGEIFVIKEEEDFNAMAPLGSSRVPGTFGRDKNNKSSTLAAYHKKVKADLDACDKRMIQLRELGYSDRQIAEKLAQEGHARYDQKSIATRIGRIRLAQAHDVDRQLKEGLKWWSLEDDQLLMRAYELADIEVRYEIERIRKWRFKKVSEYMRRLNKECIFSEDACRERFVSLGNGTAKIPIEQDDDPDARKAELEAYREELRQARNAEAAEEAHKKAAKQAKKEAVPLNAQKAAEAAVRRFEAEQKRDERIAKLAEASALRKQKAALRMEEMMKRNAAMQGSAPDGKKNGLDKNSGVSFTPLKDLKAVTENTPDPRLSLSMTDLKKLCKDVGVFTKAKSKEQLVQSLQQQEEQHTLNDLKKMCRSQGFNVCCNKVQLKYQLALAAAKTCRSFKAGEEDD